MNRTSEVVHTRPWARQACLAATLITLSAVSATSAGEFHTFGPNTFSLDASSDGLVVVWSQGEPGANDYDLYRWTPEELRIIPPPAGIKNNVFFARVSPDGRQILGRGYFLETLLTASWTWNEVEGSVSVGSSDDRRIEGAAVSDTGVVVGRAELSAKAFRWTRAGGLQLVESTVDGDYYGWFADVSADGRLCFGASRIRSGCNGAAFSIEGAQMVALEIPDDTCTSRVLGVSPDGSTAVGSAQIGAVWRSGNLTSFEEPVSPNAISGDGRIVAGRVGVDRQAIWTEKTGMIPLEAFVAAHGVTIPQGWHLYSVGAISDDGSVLVGTAINPDGKFEGWRIVLDVDTDGDGLLDTWEAEGGGIDVNGDGTIDLDLYAMVARPDRKDLFVEVDTMQGFAFPDDAQDMVEFAFDGAPLSNPDGNAGVTLHIVRDETDLPHVAAWATDGCWPDEFANYKVNAFGTPDERADENSAAILAAKARAFRYCIIADRADANVGGCGERPGNDFVVFSGTARNDEDRAAIFMHELGHNLGLRHGGGDSVNGKPNYPSIMNYTMSYRYGWNRTFWKLDFVRADDFTNLLEEFLDESSGVGLAQTFYAGWRMPFGVWFVDQSGQDVRQVRYVQLDGSPTDFGDTLGTGFQDGQTGDVVVQDLNYAANPPPGVSLPTGPSPNEDLFPYHDWAHVSLAIPEGDNSPGGQEYPEELNWDAVEWIDENFPDPPCLMDFDNDGEVDFNDLLELLDAWGNENDHAHDVAPEGGDESIDFLDLLAVLDAWGPCS